MDKEFFNGKSVLVMGLGQFGGGVDSAIFAYKAGARVIVTDLAGRKTLDESLRRLAEHENIEYHLGGHAEEDFGEGSGVDVIIVNPAVKPTNEFLQTARKAGKVITSQIEIFFQLCPAVIVGITGANGKSTTTALTAHLLGAGIGQEAAQYRKVWLSGNIGDKPLLDGLEQIYPEDVVVLELSSFQLEQLSQIQKAPHVAMITNVTPNHLDRHGSFHEYCRVKENIFRFQQLDENRPAVSIFNAEDTIAMRWLKRYKSEHGRCCLTFGPEDVPDEFLGRFSLPGRANLSNLAAAMAVAGHFGVNRQQMAHAVGTFKALEHRLELVARIKGVSWYDDSIATTPASTIAALEAFDAHKIIIAGGYDKNLPFDELGQRIAHSGSMVILIGQTAEKIEKAIRKVPNADVYIEIVDSMADAVNLAKKLAQRSDVVLLSPACASYDMFDNYRQRGEIFRKLVSAFQR